MSEQSDYREPPYTVDAVVENDGSIALIERGENPFKGLYALPGGHVDPGETPEKAVIREVAEETSINVEITGELRDYSAEINDPRYEPDEFDHRAYICSTDETDLCGGDDAADAEWVDVPDIPDELAFGHETIINDYLQDYSNE